MFTQIQRSNRTKVVLRTAVVAALAGGLVMTQQSLSGDAATLPDGGPARPAASVTATVAQTTTTQAVPAAQKKKWVTSNVSQLRRLGIQINESVLIDVADDGLDRYLNIGKGGVLDFTGTPTSDDANKMMSLKPAKVAKKAHPAKNRVVIAPPFYNEDLGTGYCVADTKKHVLRLATCKTGAASQTWHVVPAGDSGQFELHGRYTTIRVDDGKITTGSGYVGLQTIDFN